MYASAVAIHFAFYLIINLISTAALEEAFYQIEFIGLVKLGMV